MFHEAQRNAKRSREAEIKTSVWFRITEASYRHIKIIIRLVKALPPRAANLLQGTSCHQHGKSPLPSLPLFPLDICLPWDSSSSPLMFPVHRVSTQGSGMAGSTFPSSPPFYLSTISTHGLRQRPHPPPLGEGWAQSSTPKHSQCRMGVPGPP